MGKAFFRGQGGLDDSTDGWLGGLRGVCRLRSGRLAWAGLRGCVAEAGSPPPRRPLLAWHKGRPGDGRSGPLYGDLYAVAVPLNGSLRPEELSDHRPHFGWPEVRYRSYPAQGSHELGRAW